VRRLVNEVKTCLTSLQSQRRAEEQTEDMFNKSKTNLTHQKLVLQIDVTIFRNQANEI